MSRRFTLSEAQALLPEVHRLTATCDAELVALRAELGEAGVPEDKAQERLETRAQAWAESVRALGAEVKGLYLVDFDNGSGYYCWRWPEPGLDHYHTYEDGFSGRLRIQ